MRLDVGLVLNMFQKNDLEQFRHVLNPSHSQSTRAPPPDPSTLQQALFPVQMIVKRTKRGEYNSQSDPKLNHSKSHTTATTTTIEPSQHQRHPSNPQTSSHPSTFCPDTRGRNSAPNTPTLGSHRLLGIFWPVSRFGVC